MDIPTSTDIASSKSGDTFSLLYRDVDVFDTVRYDSTNWAEGFFNNVAYTDKLQAEDEAGGEWSVAIPLMGMIEESKGIVLTWSGEGITVSYSTGGAYVNATNARTILEDVDTSEIFLTIRVQFADDESYLNYVQADILKSREMQPYSGVRALTFKGASMDHTPDHQTAFTDDSGAFIENGWIQIEADPDPDNPSTIRTVEVWAKLNDTEGFFLGLTSNNYVSVSANSFTFNGVTAYRDGALVSNPAVTADWHHYVFVLSASFNQPIRIGNNIAGTNPLNMVVGHVATYPQAMTAAEVTRLYNANIGAPAISVVDSSQVRVTEPAPAVDIYAYSWSVTTGA